MNIIPRKMVRQGVMIGDLLHTINGGISQTRVKLQEKEDGAVIQLSAPGVEAEAFKVVLQNSRLTVFSELKMPNNDNLRVPLFTRVWELPAHVNLSEIDAIYQDGNLRIELPFHDSLLHPRLIKIKHVK